MRSNSERLKRLLCAEHCQFFKPWKDPQLPCGAHRVLRTLVEERPDLLEALEKLRGVRPTLPLPSDAFLARSVCTRCGYFPYRCDYRDPTGPEDALPCGGIVVMDILLSRNVLTHEELYAHPWDEDA